MKTLRFKKEKTQQGFKIKLIDAKPQTVYVLLRHHYLDSFWVDGRGEPIEIEERIIGVYSTRQGAETAKVRQQMKNEYTKYAYYSVLKMRMKGL